MIEISSQIKKATLSPALLVGKRLAHVAGITLADCYCFELFLSRSLIVWALTTRCPAHHAESRERLSGSGLQMVSDWKGKWKKKKETHAKVGLKSNMIEKRLLCLAADISFKSTKIITYVELLGAAEQTQTNNPDKYGGQLTRLAPRGNHSQTVTNS